MLTRRRARRQRGGEFSALGAMVSGKNEVGQEIFPPHPSPRPLGRRSGPSPRSPYPPPRQPSSCHADEPDTRRSYRRKRQSCGSIPGRRWCCCWASPRPSPWSGPCRGDLEMSWSTRRQVPHSPTPLMIHPPPFHRHLLLMHHVPRGMQRGIWGVGSHPPCGTIVDADGCARCAWARGCYPR